MDYSKLKNAELETLLKERSLPSGGKKADMVARLAEADKTNSASTPSAAAAGTSIGAPTTATTEPAAASIAAGGTTRADNPVAVPNQKLDTDPSATNDLSTAKDNSTSASTALPPNSTSTTDGAADDKPAPDSTPAVPFSANLDSTDLDAELAKRKARAAKFGMSEDNEEAMRAMERAKRFGTGTAGEQSGGDVAAVKGLDEALPERVRRKRERGGEGDGGRGGKRRRGGGGGGGAAGDVSGAGARPKGPGRQRSERREGGGVGWMSEADREAAERRKAKFGA